MTKQQLAAKIWNAADEMRGKIDASDYKDFILGFIFYRFVSEKEVKFLKENRWTDETLPKLNETNSYVVGFCQKNIGYFISYDNLFGTWNSRNDFTVGTVIDALNAFNRLIGEGYRKVFDGIFQSLQSGIGKLGETEAVKTKTVRKLIGIVNEIPMDNDQGYDVLGYIYEYLISNFAANAGKKAGEFYTPHEVALVMADIVAFHHRDKTRMSIYDPTSGSASLLLNIGKAVEKHAGERDGIIYYAQELNTSTYNLTRMNLVMRGIIPGNIITRNADTLERDWPFIDEQDRYTPLYVDAVVANPPYSQKWNPKNKENDPRFASYGLAPKGKADYAFLLHNLYHVNTDGIVAIVLPHGVLFRGGEEAEIRKNLVEKNNIDTIIGLPPNIFFGTGIPTLILILKKNRENKDILVIDASKGFVKDGTKNCLRDCDIRRITDTYKGRLEKEGYSRRVSLDEVRKNDYNLNIPRYVDSSEKPTSFDIYATMFGGIPEKEIDELDSYWKAFPSLKGYLFNRKKDGYYSLAQDDLADKLKKNPDVTAMSEKFASHFSDFGDWLNTELIDKLQEVIPNREKEVIAETLFERFKEIPLLDVYEAYQHLADQWVVVEGDIEVIKAEGWDAVRKVDPNMIIKTSNGQSNEVQDGWKGRILPFELVQEALLSKDLAALRGKETRLQEIESEYQTLIDMMDEDLRQALLNDDNDAFVANAVDAKLKELLDDIVTDEISTLLEYLTCTRRADRIAFINNHPEVAWDMMNQSRNGTYTQTAINRMIADLRSGMEFEEGSPEYIVSNASRLLCEEKNLKKEIKEGLKALQENTKSVIESLSDDDVKMLLKKKWIEPLTSAIAGMPDVMLKSFCDKLMVLSRKYETTYTDVEFEIIKTSASLASMINDLTGSEHDMAGLREFQKILEG